MKRYLFTICFLFALSPATLLACRCAQKALHEYFLDADTVFFGKIKKINLLNGKVQNTLTADFEPIGKVYKGKLTEHAHIITPDNSAMCGMDLQVHKTYLFFVQRTEDASDSYPVHTCSGSRAFDVNSPPTHSDFVDVPAQKVLQALDRLSVIHEVQTKGVGGVPKEKSLIGLLELRLADDEQSLVASQSLYEQSSIESPLLLHTSNINTFVTREFAYEKSALVVHAVKDGWYQVRTKDNKTGWLHPQDSLFEFFPLHELLIRRLSYVTREWDGFLWPDPGAGIPQKFSHRIKAITVEKTTRIADSLWLYVKLYKADPCVTGKQEYSHAGWIPAWNQSGGLTAWFWSRGC